MASIKNDNAEKMNRYNYCSDMTLAEKLENDRNADATIAMLRRAGYKAKQVNDSNRKARDTIRWFLEGKKP